MQSTPEGPQLDPQQGGYCRIGQDTTLAWYSSMVGNGALRPDPAQLRVVRRLQELSNRLSDGSAGRQEGSFLAGLLGGSRQQGGDGTAGIYIHGSVGRGKSFLMDGFFLNLRRTDKLRVHFHGFMRHLHADMKRLDGSEDPLAQVAGRLSDRFGLICFDEFHVSDIVDAMILGRMLEIFIDQGVVLVATSNYAPDGLYPNGLARDRFLPAIKLLSSRFEVCSLDGDTDYRFRALSSADVYLAPADADMRQRFAGMFEQLANGIELTPSIPVASRRMPVRKRTSDAVWLDFAEACSGNYGQADYLQLAERFTTVFLSGVPRLGTAEQAEATRRFTWLVDVLYDSRIKLVMLAEQGLASLFEGEGGESGRTLSRLSEMQSAAYLEELVRAPQDLLQTA